MPTEQTAAGEPGRNRPGILGWIGPAIVLACLLLDVSFRFLPPRFVAYRAWEAVRLFATASGPFAPNTVYRNPKAYGDLANMANLPSLRQYRPESFTTNSEGYRNRHERPTPFNGILLLGDSFGASTGVPDDQSLGEQLAQASGLPVYNASGNDYAFSMDELRKGCSWVVWEQSERRDLPTEEVMNPKPGWKGRLFSGLLGETGRAKARSMVEFFNLWWPYSPLEIWSGRLIKTIENDRILPNPYRQLVDVRTLPNGREMLIFPQEELNYLRDRPTDPAFLIQVGQRLQANGIGFLVVLVPDKFVVYHDLLVPSNRAPSTPRQPFMDIVAERLAAAHIPVVNLTETFRAQAAPRLAQNSYLYWFDDTHWNGDGIRLAANEIVKSGLVPKHACPAGATQLDAGH